MGREIPHTNISSPYFAPPTITFCIIRSKSASNPIGTSFLTPPTLPLLFIPPKPTVKFDKITSRIEKMCYGLNKDYVDPVAVAQKVVQGVYPGVTTAELDELAAQTCAYQATQVSVGFTNNRTLHLLLTPPTPHTAP